MVVIALQLLAGSLDSPLPPSFEALVKVANGVARSPVAYSGSKSPVWRQSQASWGTTWGHGCFGIGRTVEDASRFRFRVPPDADARQIGGKEPFLVESYRNGMPLLAVRRTESGDPARPLGFSYGLDGLCTNVTVRVLKEGRWRTPRLTRLAKTVLGRAMAQNEYLLENLETLRPPSFGTPWIRIEAKGYGDYWIDQELNCVGPFGAYGRIIVELEEDMKGIVEGR